MADTPSTKLSLRHLHDLGYTTAVVEHWNAFAHIRQDLFGFIDILALKGDETMAVQTTSATNVAAHIRKIADNPNLAAVREAGWTIRVHGWAKNKSNRWELKRDVDVS